jgi:hypothetical protein
MVSFWLLPSVMAEALKGVYRPRNPQATSFYQLVEDHPRILLQDTRFLPLLSFFASLNEARVNPASMLNLSLE